MSRGFVVIGTVDALDASENVFDVPPGLDSFDLLLAGGDGAGGTANVSVVYASRSGAEIAVVLNGGGLGGAYTISQGGQRIEIRDNGPSKVRITRSVAAAGVVTVAVLPRIVN